MKRAHLQQKRMLSPLRLELFRVVAVNVLSFMILEIP